MATTQQERDWIANLEEMGVARAKMLWDRNEISPGSVSVTSIWLAEKEEVHQFAQMTLMRRDSAATQRQATAAERANTRANVAIWVAAVSLVVSIVFSILTLLKH